MWEIIVGIILMIIGIGMIVTSLILFFAFDLNGWYIVFIAILGTALFLIGMLLWMMVNTYRNNNKLQNEDAKQIYNIANPALLKDQKEKQQKMANELTPPLSDNSQPISGQNIGLSGESQKEEITGTSSGLLSTESSNTNSPTTEPIVSKDDESSLFEL